MPPGHHAGTLHEGNLAVREFWSAIQHKFELLEGDAPLLYGGYPMPYPLDLDRSLLDYGITQPSNAVYVVPSRVAPLPSAVANAIPALNAAVPRRPPAAFKRKKELTARDGHVILLEYLEERPPLLSRPGMGVRLTTYYRKRYENEPLPEDLLNVTSEAGGAAAEGGAGGGGGVVPGGGEDGTAKEAWMVGLAQGINPDDESMFLGDIGPGQVRSCELLLS